jgi:copper chaperone CopZ
MAQEHILMVTGMDCAGCVKAVTRAATGAGTAPISVDLKSGEMRLPDGADLPAIAKAIQRAGFGVAP